VEEGTSGRFGGQLSAVLFLLCGSLVAVAVPLVPSAPSANQGALLGIAGVTLATGAVIWLLPWHRWPRASTLALLPPTFALITAYNFFAGVDGFRYAPFFFITFGWIGLVHPRGTSAKVLPLAIAAYLIPLAAADHWDSIAAWSAVYVLPSGVLLGEATAWVSDRLGRTQHSLREQEASFRKLFLENPQPMWVFDLEDLRFLEVNAATIEHYGYTREEFLAMRVTEIRPADDVRAFLDEIAVAPALHHSPVAWRHVLKDGRLIEVDVTAHRLEFKGRAAMLTAIQDVTERNSLERELRHRAFHDALTDLANRSLFANRLEHALARQARNESSIGVVVLDLDGFKTVNDSLGHSVGDDLLFAVGDRLRTAVRPGDTVARLGGDEFAILLEDEPTIEHLGEHAERILASFAEPFELAGKSLVVTASAGVTLNRPGDGPDELIRNADMAMYLAKRDGKSCVRRFEPAMHHAALDRLELEADLRRALQRDEFVVHYQPTVQIATGGISGFEALVRWDHPRRGLLSPSDFIPLAEETGLIIDIGRWVLERACHQARAWQETHAELDLTMSVNLSARQLRDPHLVADVAATLRDSGIDPRSLVLEITETVLMDNSDAAIDRLHQLKALGVRLAIDDFGTGYSSLNYLRALPVDIVKIDKVFIDGVAFDKEARGLIKAILSMADTLDLQTVAEGVESRAQASRLEQLGSALVQGFYYARPLTVEAAEALMTTGATGVDVPSLPSPSPSPKVSPRV
jgi:diguanylate cyclase (GGDEF)-like protein/PAS domain S-box-containing protein